MLRGGLLGLPQRRSPAAEVHLSFDYLKTLPSILPCVLLAISKSLLATLDLAMQQYLSAAFRDVQGLES